MRGGVCCAERARAAGCRLLLDAIPGDACRRGLEVLAPKMVGEWLTRDKRVKPLKAGQKDSKRLMILLEQDELEVQGLIKTALQATRVSWMAATSMSGMRCAPRLSLFCVGTRRRRGVLLIY